MYPHQARNYCSKTINNVFAVKYITDLIICHNQHCPKNANKTGFRASLRSENFSIQAGQSFNSKFPSPRRAFTNQFFVRFITLNCIYLSKWTNNRPLDLIPYTLYIVVAFLLCTKNICWVRLNVFNFDELHKGHRTPPWSSESKSKKEMD